MFIVCKAAAAAVFLALEILYFEVGFEGELVNQMLPYHPETNT